MKQRKKHGIPFRRTKNEANSRNSFPNPSLEEKKRLINQNDQGDEMEGLEMEGDDFNGESLEREGVKELYTLFQPK
jgi:hypothetical protein